MSENTKAKATKQSVAKIVHIEFTDKQRASLMPLVEELRKAQQEDKVTVTIGQLDACFLLSRGYTSAWFTILHEEVGKQVLDAMTPIFRGLKRKIVNELDDESEWHADPYAELEQARTERNIMAREASAAQARAEAAETQLAKVRDDVGTIMMLVRPEPHEHEYIAAKSRLSRWLWPHPNEVQP